MLIGKDRGASARPHHRHTWIPSPDARRVIWFRIAFPMRLSAAVASWILEQRGDRQILSPSENADLILKRQRGSGLLKSKGGGHLSRINEILRERLSRERKRRNRCSICTMPLPSCIINICGSLARSTLVVSAW